VAPTNQLPSIVTIPSDFYGINLFKFLSLVIIVVAMANSSKSDLCMLRITPSKHKGDQVAYLCSLCTVNGWFGFSSWDKASRIKVEV